MTVPDVAPSSTAFVAASAMPAMRIAPEPPNAAFFGSAIASPIEIAKPRLEPMS
ncbi:MAG: hypothetical protein IPF82_23035 [Blastocatellia bacterium]|nr:hypothetical protein [Blastocatellia bacterium]